MTISYKNPFHNYSTSEVEKILTEVRQESNKTVMDLRFRFAKNKKSGNRPDDIIMTVDINDVGWLEEVLKDMD